MDRTKVVLGRGSGDEKRVDGLVFSVDGALWGHMEAHHLWVRLALGRTWPARATYPAPPKDAAFIRRVVTGPRRGAPLEAKRSKVATIFGVEVDAAILDGIERDHGPVLWRMTDDWFVAYVERRVVALWKLPTGKHVLDLAMKLHDGELWTTNGHFACVFQMSLPESARMAVSARALPDPAMSAELVAMFAAVEGTAPVDVEREGDGDVDQVRIGESYVPAGQYLTVVANCGTEVVWYSTGARSPAVGKVGGKPVALILPLVTGA